MTKDLATCICEPFMQRLLDDIVTKISEESAHLHYILVLVKECPILDGVTMSVAASSMPPETAREVVNTLFVPENMTNAPSSETL